MITQSNHAWALLLFLVSLTITSCQGVEKPVSQDEDIALQVTVSVLPQAYFVERIAGDLAAANIMVGPGEEAHTYEPKPEQMKALTLSQLFFTIGVEYEQTWLPRFKDINPDMVIVDSTQGIKRIPLSSEYAHEGENHQGELDPHVWLSPSNGRIIAENIFNALSDAAPQNMDVFLQNYQALITDIDNLDKDIEIALENIESRQFMVFHPAWGYFADQYNLEQIPIQVGGQDPSASELAQLITIARGENIKVIFVQPSFDTDNAEAIAGEIGAQVAIVDPLARDWLGNLETAAQAFASALENRNF